jgi:phosphoserine phosphatase
MYEANGNEIDCVGYEIKDYISTEICLGEDKEKVLRAYLNENGIKYDFIIADFVTDKNIIGRFGNKIISNKSFLEDAIKEKYCFTFEKSVIAA